MEPVLLKHILPPIIIFVRNEVNKKNTVVFAFASCFVLQVFNIAVSATVMPPCTVMFTIYAGCAEDSWTLYRPFDGNRKNPEVQTGRDTWL